MSKSVKIFWALSAISLVITAVFGIMKEIWYALIMLVFAATYIAIAIMHNKECEATQKKIDTIRDEANLEVKLAHEREIAGLGKAKDEIFRFHSLISHGLRIPISIIIGYSDLIRDGMVIDDKVRDEYIHKICEKANCMNDLLAHVLLEMRYETKMSDIIRQPIELISLLCKVADEMANISAKNGIVINVVTNDSEIYIDGDITGLTKAFYNIVENSIKYMGKRGFINITVSRINDDDVFIVFKDDGLGLNPDEAKNIFELNYQGSNKKSGNGLGLYIVKTEIMSHGGTVHAKSDIGQGMGVYITLPLKGSVFNAVEQNDQDTQTKNNSVVCEEIVAEKAG